jgi:NADH:ubiquinone oxidoreductase subunit 4 (subunit M)
VPGGILRGKVSTAALPLLLGLFVYGCGKAALMPLHRWLPAAMVAPTPVSALLHAVAVVKAGVFAILKIVVYVFGLDLLRETGSSDWLMGVAAMTILLASLIALRQDNLKARLAYSTISQLAYIVLGAAMVTPDAILGGGLHIATHALGKITLFFCAGAIIVTAHKTEVSQLDGLGRKMPWTMAAFFIGALSIIGLPPTAGSWSKWLLGAGRGRAVAAVGGGADGQLSAGHQLLAAHPHPRVLLRARRATFARSRPLMTRNKTASTATCSLTTTARPTRSCWCPCASPRSVACSSSSTRSTSSRCFDRWWADEQRAPRS